MPAIIFFFGGGWRGGTPSQFFPHCEHLASRGMVAICPNALVLFNPAPDTTREPLRSRWPEGLAERISPLQRVRPGLPPAIVLHGMADATVPYAEAEAFCTAMAASGNRCELMGFVGQGHGFFNYGRGDGLAYRETVRARDGYLTSLGYLSVIWHLWPGQPAPWNVPVVGPNQRPYFETYRQSEDKAIARVSEI